VIQVKGRMFIIDRGRASGMKEGMILEVMEPVGDSLVADAGFPFGKARVRAVREETSVLELISAEAESDLSKVEIRTSFSVIRPLENALENPRPGSKGPPVTKSVRTLAPEK
jgi:hypothetical protein